MVLPKITIITPTLNTGESIETALLSVANQTYQNIEHLIVDSASNDKTLPTIRKYLKKYKNIRLLTEKDSGVYQAMNKGMDLSTGDWIYFMGANDAFYNENTLTDLFEQGLFQEEQIVYGNVSVLGDTSWAKNGSIYDGMFELKKLLRKNICHQCIFYPRSVIKQIGYYTEKYSISADWDYNFRCFFKYKFTYTDKIIAFFQSGGISMGGDDTLSKDLVNIIKQHFQLDPYSESVYDEDSPFYYLMSRYREMEFSNRIIALEAEAESLRQHIADQQTIHFESVTNMEKQHEKVISAMRLEFDGALNNLRTENTNFLFTLRSEHDQVIATLKEENTSHLTNLKTEHDNDISKLKVEHGHFVTNLRTEYKQEISNLKIEHSNLISNQQTEHNQEITNLKIEHGHLVSDMRIEQNQAIASLKAAHDHVVDDLKSSHAESFNAQKDNYETLVKSLQSEQSRVLQLFQKKESEFKQQIDNLNHTLTSAEKEFRETIEKYNQELENLKTDLFARNQQIAVILNSSTWKAGKILLAPAAFIAKTINSKKHGL